MLDALPMANRHAHALERLVEMSGAVVPVAEPPSPKFAVFAAAATLYQLPDPPAGVPVFC